MLLRGLEHEVDGAVQVLGPGQQAGGAQQHGHVAVVAAGVHAARAPGGVGVVADFLDGQGVHVGPEADGAGAAAQAQGAHQPGAADAPGHLQAQGGQGAGHELGGLPLLEPGFGMACRWCRQAVMSRSSSSMALLQRS